MISIDGDVKELRHLVEGLEKLATPESRHELAERLARVAKIRTLLEFDEGKDPYGRQWAPLTSRDGRPLNDRGLLKGSFGFAAVGDNVRIGTNIAFAGTHQYGATIKPKNAKALVFHAGGLRPNSPARKTGDLVFAKEVHIPQRQMLPEGDLGPIWSKDFADEANDYLSEQLGE